MIFLKCAVFISCSSILDFYIWRAVRYSAALYTNFCCDLRPIPVHIRVRNSGRVDIDRKPILHGNITRAGDMGPNRHGFVTADGLKP